MTTRTWVNSGTLKPEISKREILHSRLAKEAAVEGIVLLKNENVLPFVSGVKLAVLGSGSEYTVKGGIGSGDVNNRESISIYKGLTEAGVTITSEAWIQEYHACHDHAREVWKEKVLEDTKRFDNPFDAYAENPFALPDGRAVQKSDIEGAEAVIYVVSRISGEGKDRRRVEGDYFLSKREQEDLLFLNEAGIPIVLMINAGGQVELTEVLAQLENIKAVLNLSQLGQEGGYAVADVLLGKQSPGGRLTTTWARHYEDYPSGETFSYLNGDLEKEEYREGIYVGYRYFDSFGIEPLFPFGYGLTYTTFEMGFEALRIKEAGLELDVTVKNVGEAYAGREVVQIYATLPQTDVAREYHRLVGFAKTNVLQPGEAQTLSIVINQKELAVFLTEQAAWMMEAGTYGLWIGRDSADVQLVATLHVDEQAVVEKTHSVCPIQTELEELGKAAFASVQMETWMQNAREQHVPQYEFVPKEEKKRIYQFPYASEQKAEELIPLLYGNITKGASTLGSAGIRVPGSAGESSEQLEKDYGIRSLIMADGPAGLRLRQSYEIDRETNSVYGLGVFGALENGILEPMVYHENADLYYQYCSAFPVGTALAQMWDLDMMRRVGEAIAVEMEEFHVDLWLAPGMNIHRNPLCGRNYEYFSEDPFLTGCLAAAVTRGVQSRPGCGVTIKHFACNNQEDNRMGVDAQVSEKALREIYLRGFEIAIKESQPVSIMTSYNLINGVHSANSRDLCTTLAREEWGFDGAIMTDWNTTVPEDGSIPWKCADAGNDIIMPGSPQDDQSIREAYANGQLTEKTIRTCAGSILRMIERLDG